MRQDRWPSWLMRCTSGALWRCSVSTPGAGGCCPGRLSAGWPGARLFSVSAMPGTPESCPECRRNSCTVKQKIEDVAKRLIIYVALDLVAQIFDGRLALRAAPPQETHGCRIAFDGGLGVFFQAHHVLLFEALWPVCVSISMIKSPSDKPMVFKIWTIDSQRGININCPE